MAHQPDEYCVIANMVGNAKVFTHLFLARSALGLALWKYVAFANAP